MGLNSETCYVLIKYHHSQQLWGGTFCSKAPPVDYINKWLLQYGLDDSVKDRYVRLDPGGDLGGCTATVVLFESTGYTVEVTAPDSSHMNGPVECPHQTAYWQRHACNAWWCRSSTRVLAVLLPSLHPLVQCNSTSWQ
jgi:hypothetical protein